MTLFLKLGPAAAGVNQSNGPPSLIHGTKPPCRWVAMAFGCRAASGKNEPESTGMMCVLGSRFLNVIWIGLPFEARIVMPRCLAVLTSP